MRRRNRIDSKDMLRSKTPAGHSASRPRKARRRRGPWPSPPRAITRPHYPASGHRRPPASGRQEKRKEWGGVSFREGGLYFLYSLKYTDPSGLVRFCAVILGKLVCSDDVGPVQGSITPDVDFQKKRLMCTYEYPGKKKSKDKDYCFLNCPREPSCSPNCPPESPKPPKPLA